MGICKKHPSEPPVGVCASCLRDRLLSLQACISQLPCLRSSDHVTQQLQNRSSRPLFITVAGAPQPPPPGGFSVFSTLFGTPGGGPSPYESHDHSTSALQPPAVEAPSFASWLAAVFAVRSRKSKRLDRVAGTDGGASSVGSSSAPSMSENKVQEASCPPCRPSSSRFSKYRGMSPASEQEEEEETRGDEKRATASSSSGSSAYSDGRHAGRPCPTDPAPIRNIRRRDTVAVTTDFAVCFSPLVHARFQHHRGGSVVAADCGGGRQGELQQPGFRVQRQGHPQVQQQHQRHRLRYDSGGGGVTLYHNRSRKLVDLGRFR